MGAARNTCNSQIEFVSILILIIELRKMTLIKTYVKLLFILFKPGNSNIILISCWFERFLPNLLGEFEA